jgi:hypothetical protein
MEVAKTMRVGRSSRTPLKHWVLDTHLGKIVGVLSSGNRDVPARCTPFLCVDLCAGDGDESEGHQSSPGIITGHCEWLAGRGKPVRSVFIERHSNTFEVLERNVDVSRFKHQCELICGDAREFRVNPTSPDQAIFVNCDPNAISDMPLAEEFARSLTRTTTMTTTLGCNVGGLKKLTLEKRRPWYDYMQIMVDIMPPWHDAILVSLIRDAAQWAYFTRLPSKWVPDNGKRKGQLSQLVTKGNAMWPNGVEVASLRLQPEKFRDMVNRLFLTKGEYDERS